MLVLITYRTEEGLNVWDMTRYLIGSEHMALSCVWQSGAKTPKQHLHWMLGPVDVNAGTERCVFECIHPMWGVLAGSTLERHSTRVDLCSGCSITFFSSLPPFPVVWVSSGCGSLGVPGRPMNFRDTSDHQDETVSFDLKHFGLPLKAGRNDMWPCCVQLHSP